MAYDEDLARRIRDAIGALDPPPGVITEKKMFGGLAFLIGGNMAVAASGKGGMMVRMDPDDADRLPEDPHVGPMVMGGRTMRGWIRVEAPAIATDEDLHTWLRRGVDCAAALPPK